MNKKIKKIRSVQQFHGRIGLSHHRHTGRLLPNHRTSYGIMLLLLLLLAPNLVITRGINGVVTSSSNVQVSATVPGPAPTVPAVITSPSSGTSSSQTITVSGTCGAGLLVKIFRNDVFAGSTYCDGVGNFSLVVTLYTGKNDLRALNYDTLDQPGPVSPTVSITYTPPSQSIIKTPKKFVNLLLEADYHLRQINPDVSATWQYKISLGTPPYAVKTDWGDSTLDNTSVPGEGDFSLEHSFSNSGIYKIITTVTDANGAITSIQLAVTVNGTPIVTLINTASTKKITSSRCSGTWLSRSYCSFGSAFKSNLIPLYWLLVIVVGFTWLFMSLKRRRRDSQLKPAH